MTRLTSASSRTDQLSLVGEKLVGLKKPRKQLQGYQQWQVENRESLGKEVALRWQRKEAAGEDLTKVDLLVFRQAVAREMFNDLDEAAQKECVKRAALFAEQERLAFEQARKEIPTRTAETLQS